MRGRPTALVAAAALGAALLGGYSHGEGTATADPWARLPDILAGIRAPAFPDRDFPVTDYGAVGDGTTDATDAFRAAVAACAGAGGGRVVVPGGIFLTGPIHLLSNVNLHLEEGATIRFRRDPAAYLPVVLTRWEGVELMNYSPLVYAYGETNVAVTGRGVRERRSVASSSGTAPSAEWPGAASSNTWRISACRT